MTTPIRVYSTPAASTADLVARVAREKSIGWAAARGEVASAAGLEVSAIEAIERGDVPTAEMLTRLSSAVGIVQREAGAFIGYRATGTITRAAGDNGPSYHFTMSTDNVDRADDIVEQDWDLSGFNSNPVAFYNHNTWGLPIGRWANVAGQPLTGDFIPYAPKAADMHPLASLVADMLEQGHLHACSVGFVPTAVISRAQLPRDDARYSQRGYVYIRPRLLECSVVGIPMNQDACRPMVEPKPTDKSFTAAKPGGSNRSPFFG